MPTLMKVKMDAKARSRAVADGSLPQVMQETLGVLAQKRRTSAQRAESAPPSSSSICRIRLNFR